eukprot:9141705-Pyramimonas_sp.AAC.1
MGLVLRNLSEVVVVEARAAGVEYDMTLPPIDPARCQAREAVAIKSAEDEAKKIGINVSDLAQEIFDALSKTYVPKILPRFAFGSSSPNACIVVFRCRLPCRWADKSIIVMDEVKIDEPYTPECCKGSKDTSLSRVRKVVSH